MSDASKITVLLADEDALRRDGLAAVLSKDENFQIVGGVSDGQEALEQIRDLRPHVAVVDLNLPLLHGIELVRRVRGESLGTKLIMMAGTDSDDIVREAVRAGADGYLLKNGPARHLVDAISYVRDGGQYFSPQLKRDGRDRHLLEEPPRLVAADTERGPTRSSGARRSAPRAGDTAYLRERLREEVADRDMGDRDYEIMSMMADGIRPILDRLDEIDSRVSHMETGDEPVPEDPRAWLTTQLADSVGGRGGLAPVRGAADLEASLPAMIEEAVTKRFQQMAGKLQEEIEETHVRTLETFVKNVQVKLVQRVSALEQDMSAQAQAMVQLQEYSQRTEDNLSRLISGVDKLAKELPRRLAAAAEAPAVEAEVEGVAPGPKPSLVRKRRRPDTSLLKKVWAGLAVLVLLAGLGFGLKKMFSRSETATVTAGAAGGEQPAAAPKPKASVPAATDTKSRLEAAKECIDRKEYQTAEDLYRQIIKTEPSNSEALQGLASVLYREDKIEEAASILDKLPKN